MTKFYAILTVILIALFGGIVYATQGESIKKTLTAPNTAIPTLPPEANTFLAISPTSSQTQEQVQGQQTQAQQQQQVAPTYGVEEGVKASYSATIRTSKGNITITLFGKDAPNTVKNFLEKAKSNYYKNLTFHRVEDWVIQGGDPKGNGTGGGMMQTEMNSIPFTTGSLGVARGGDINVSNASQFFITKTDSPHLNQQYTNFGEVTEGMDVVNKIQIGDKILGITIE
jgi:peptidyl-prolyl cis-trans isomerase B (cyclophilin B)